MGDFLIILIPLLPLIGFLINGLFGKFIGEKGGWIATGCMGASALICLVLFWGAFLGGAFNLPIQVDLWNWMTSGDLNVSIGFRIDQLTVLMLFFVTFVSTLVFLYSIGYMHGDPGFNRFFAYLCLFDFSMLILVMADSLPLLFVGWEGVGLCSYLLIGYYMDMKGAPDAGKKAFIVNRIGDLGMVIGMFMLYVAFETLNIQEIMDNLDKAPTLVYAGSAFVTVLTLFLFLGATGKSAQIPLFVWLPDAMAGPTPVSALIHAATMVTAGVYMCVRMSPLFALAPDTLAVIAIVGGLTALVAGTIGCTQRDIKKVLAYSTVSQLGYMFMAVGCGAFVAAIFHVFTHAFFKACLFLGSGSVIHACHHEQDMTKMGGLKKWMPKTRWTFFIGCLGLAGIPGLAGFISKDEIIWKSFISGHSFHLIIWGIGLLTAFITAFYTFRAYTMTFEGENRLDEHTRKHLHESPWTMTVPLIILAAGTCVAGLLNLPHVINAIFGGHHGFVHNFLHPVTAQAEGILASTVVAERELPGKMGFEILLMVVSGAMACIVSYLAYYIYKNKYPALPRAMAANLRPLYNLSYNKWWWDDFYNFFIAGGLRVIAKLSVLFDKYIIDGVLHLTAGTAKVGSMVMRGMQNGQVQGYALWILIGANLVVFIVLKQFMNW